MLGSWIYQVNKFTFLFKDNIYTQELRRINQNPKLPYSRQNSSVLNRNKKGMSQIFFSLIHRVKCPVKMKKRRVRESVVNMARLLAYPLFKASPAKDFYVETNK